MCTCLIESVFSTAEINHNLVNQLYVSKTLKKMKKETLKNNIHSQNRKIDEILCHNKIMCKEIFVIN